MQYRDPVEINSLSDNIVAVFLEVASLLNFCVEQIVILNDITQDKNKILEDKSKNNFKFHRLERNM